MDLKQTIQAPENGVLTFYHGAAPAVRLKNAVKYNGIITAPADWYEGKCQTPFIFPFESSIVLVNELMIKLCIDEYNESESTIIIGEISINNDLKMFGINTSKKFGSKELASLLKMNRIYFADSEENMQIVKNLNLFKVKVSQEIENGNDFKGNKKHLFEQSVYHDLKLSFALNIPIYKGEKPSHFIIDINFDVTDGGVSFWLESVELKELQQVQRDNIIDRELKRLKDFTIIKQF